jgi:tRNA U55 pseudouridine synthase TruB
VDATLGETTPTLDRDPGVSARLTRVPWRHVARDDLTQALGLFRGECMQMPPLYSALKIGKGRRASDAARLGEPLVMRTRAVAIDSATLTAFHPPHFSLGGSWF